MATSAPSQMWGVGDRVRVRRERWRVAAVDGDVACRVITLDGLGPHNFAEQRILLEPFETIEPLGPRTAPGTRRLGDLRWRSGRRRWRRACRHVLASVGPWTRLRSVDTANIAVMPHQLEPALAVLGGRGARVLLADAVGLGKTVQAGVLLSELLRRGVAHSALVLTPAGLRDQWQQELSTRFNLQADIIDFRATARLTWDLPLGVNPWSTCPLAIASVDYVKRPEVLPAVHARGWDILIVDEAHAVTPGSDRYAGLAQLCRSALFVFLLTATPHSGDRMAFAALRALGACDSSADDCLLFRRSRADVSSATRRRVHLVGIRPSPAESRMHAALDDYADAADRVATDARNAMLLVSTLRKRALSSPRSLLASVNRRLRVLDAVASGASREPSVGEQLPLPLSDPNDNGGSWTLAMRPRALTARASTTWIASVLLSNTCVCQRPGPRPPNRSSRRWPACCVDSRGGAKPSSCSPSIATRSCTCNARSHPTRSCCMEG
ncbi:MAG: DEAD/DEAH box helicase [Acidimicrobiia bacterium]|nr:DEAD/DEAH box helicase [Acidimicrobiia bacterium]